MRAILSVRNAVLETNLLIFSPSDFCLSFGDAGQGEADMELKACRWISGSQVYGRLWEFLLIFFKSLLYDQRGSSVMLMASRLTRTGMWELMPSKLFYGLIFHRAVLGQTLICDWLWNILQRKAQWPTDKIYKKSPGHNVLSFKRKVSWSPLSLNGYPKAFFSLHVPPPPSLARVFSASVLRLYPCAPGCITIFIKYFCDSI